MVAVGLCNVQLWAAIALIKNDFGAAAAAAAAAVNDDSR